LLFGLVGSLLAAVWAKGISVLFEWWVMPRFFWVSFLRRGENLELFSGTVFVPLRLVSSSLSSRFDSDWVRLALIS